MARLIHRLDGRPGKKKLIVLDCATVVPSLSGSEFFGHEKGAFTGAAGPRDGAFALADGGTLFLDEARLPPNLQAELLRVIQEGMYKRVGSNTWRTTNFRLVSATNRDLVEDQEAGRFRLDLYYRIAAWQFRLPSLRERRDDIELLAQNFLSRSCANGAAPRFEPAWCARSCSPVSTRETSGICVSSSSGWASAMWATVRLRSVTSRTMTGRPGMREAARGGRSADIDGMPRVRRIGLRGCRAGCQPERDHARGGGDGRFGRAG